MVDAQEWLDKYYPLEKRKEVTNLNAYNKELTSELNLNDFVNLEYLTCAENHLVELQLDACEKLKTIYCDKNKLVTLNLGKQRELITLVCSNNLRLTNLELRENFHSRLEIDCSFCPKLAISLVIGSQHKNLSRLSCRYNNLTFLDVSKYEVLKKQ